MLAQLNLGLFITQLMPIPRLAKCQAPAQVIAAANRQVAALTSASTKTTVAATKLKLSDASTGINLQNLPHLIQLKHLFKISSILQIQVLEQLKSAVSLVTIYSRLE
jgi:hypothetical protein